MSEKITKKKVNEYVTKNCPSWSIHETNGIKGIYRKDQGPAASFRGIGKTWADVMRYVKAN